MRKNIIFVSGLYAGLISGLLYALLIVIFVKPFIFKAEIAAGEAGSITSKYVGTLIGTVVIGSALGLILATVYDGLGHKYKNSWRAAPALGGAGWLVFNLIPAIAYPPNPPGIHGGLDLAVKQQWWLIVLAVGAVAVTLGWSVYARLKINNVALKAAISIIPFAAIIAVMLILRPVDTVHPSSASSLFLTEFRLASLSAGLIFWLSLGLSTAYFYRKHDVE